MTPHDYGIIDNSSLPLTDDGIADNKPLTLNDELGQPTPEQYAEWNKGMLEVAVEFQQQMRTDPGCLAAAIEKVINKKYWSVQANNKVVDVFCRGNEAGPFNNAGELVPTPEVIHARMLASTSAPAMPMIADLIMNHYGWPVELVLNHHTISYYFQAYCNDEAIQLYPGDNEIKVFVCGQVRHRFLWIKGDWQDQWLHVGNLRYNNGRLQHELVEDDAIQWFNTFLGVVNKHRSIIGL